MMWHTSRTATTCTAAGILAAGCMLCAACSDTPPEELAANLQTHRAPYVVERSTDNGIETVRTLSGQRWEGTPRLVEALSIGAEEGDDAYLFGTITAAWATADRLYVVDSQVPTVRAFDQRGHFLHQLGDVGQGPGEYVRPIALVVDADDRVLVTDVQGGRLSVFGRDGQSLEDWPLGSPRAALGLQLGNDGEVYTRVMVTPTEAGAGGYFALQEAMQRVTSAGHTGDPILPPKLEWEPPTVAVAAGQDTFDMDILPFAPQQVWTFAPGGEMIAGVGNEYRLEVHLPDGTVRVIEKAWKPVPVDPAEREFRAETAAAAVRPMAPEFRLRASQVPAHKAAFKRLYADRSDRLWVTRQGPSETDPYCREAEGDTGMVLMMRSDGNTEVSSGSGSDAKPQGECWRSTLQFDVFALTTGDFLGTVAAPTPGFTRPLFVRNDIVLAAVIDDVGTVRLKKYALVID